MCVHIMYMHTCIYMQLDVWRGMGMIVYMCMSIYMHMSTRIMKLIDVLVLNIFNQHILYMSLCLKCIHTYIPFRSL